MARYVGDLTDPDNAEMREDAALLVERVAVKIRNREVRRMDVSFDRDVIYSGVLGISPEIGDWVVQMKVTPRGRHER